MTTITLVSMVRDESKAILPMLDSCLGLIDMGTIIDTGSTDSTKDLIQAWSEEHHIPITIYDEPFVNFVETKNLALDYAHKSGADWILFMDADERIVRGQDQMRWYVEGGEYDAVAAWILEGKDINETIVNKYARLRMWRNTGEYLFVGPGVHEVIEQRGNVVGDPNIQVWHDHGHRTPESYEARFKQYTDILNKWLAEHPDDLRAMFYQARSLRELGGANLYTAIAIYERYLELSEQDTYLDQKWNAAYDLALCWKGIGEYEKAMKACQRAIDIDPRRAETMGLKGMFPYQLGDWQDALAYFQKASELPEPTDVLLFLDPRAYSVAPLNYMSVCLDRTHQYREALATCTQILGIMRKPDVQMVSNAAYLRQKTGLKWFFTLGHTPEPVYGGMIDKIGVGGVETTYLELPEHLAKLGHDTFVFCTTDHEHVHEGVNFIPYQKLGDYVSLNPDVVVSSRWFDPICDIKTGVKIIWLQDAWFADPKRPEAWDKTHLVIVSSPWHRNYLAERMSDRLDAGKAHVIPLGIRKAMFTGSFERNPMQTIYSSIPDRGLLQLKEMWPEISKQNPGISLLIAYGWEGLKTWSSDPAWTAYIKQQKKEIEEWSNAAGNVFLTGRLTKRQLYEVMMSSGLCLYPNNFQETMCLTGLETQAAGVPMITTRLGALPTTLDQSCNILIDGYPTLKSYQQQFITQTTALLHDRNRMADWSRKCTTTILRNPHDWEDIAQAWEHMIFQII